jgi:hypothetical protein
MVIEVLTGLDVVFRPPHPSGDAVQLQHVLLAFAFAKVQDRAVFSDVEFAGPWFNVVAAEGADAFFDH